jgi:Transposase, Mutator family
VGCDSLAGAATARPDPAPAALTVPSHSTGDRHTPPDSCQNRLGVRQRTNGTSVGSEPDGWSARDCLIFGETGPTRRAWLGGRSSHDKHDRACSGRIDQQQLAQQLVAAAGADGVELVGPGGLLSGLTKTVLETALDAEMTEHLGNDRHDPTGHDGGNSRNGTRTKTVLTEVGPEGRIVPAI